MTPPGPARFTRTALLLGPERMARLAVAHVVVVGLGAVGSYVVEGLARAGVGRLRLVDFDTVETTNINRQLYALDSTCGRPKHQVARDRVLDINPDCQVEALGLFVEAATLDPVLAGPPDAVVDAIDALGPKVELLAAATRRGLLVVSSMGAARRTDPAAVRVAPLRQSHHCPLARRVRQQLRRLHGIDGDFLCVHSVEPRPRRPAATVAAAGGPPPLRATSAAADSVAPDRSRRPLGSLPTVTGIFGLTAAHTVLQLLCGGLGPTAEDRSRAP